MVKKDQSAVGLSPSAVETHPSRIMDKLALPSTADVVDARHYSRVVYTRFSSNECCNVGLWELEAISVLAGPQLRAVQIPECPNVCLPTGRRPPANDRSVQCKFRRVTLVQSLD